MKAKGSFKSFIVHVLGRTAVLLITTGWHYQYFITDALTFETLKKGYHPEQKICTALV